MLKLQNYKLPNKLYIIKTTEAVNPIISEKKQIALNKIVIKNKPDGGRKKNLTKKSQKSG